MDNVDTALAEEKFRAGFKDAVSYDEVFQLITKLKQRKSTAEKNEEILGCTERAASWSVSRLSMWCFIYLFINWIALEGLSRKIAEKITLIVV